MSLFGVLIVKLLKLGKELLSFYIPSNCCTLILFIIIFLLSSKILAVVALVYTFIFFNAFVAFLDSTPSSITSNDAFDPVFYVSLSSEDLNLGLSGFLPMTLGTYMYGLGLLELPFLGDAFGVASYE